MRTIETKVYTFDELGDSAKERARDWYRQGNDDDLFWSESVISDACEIAEILGIELSTRTVKLMNGNTRQEPQIFWSLGYSQSDGASFEGRWRYSKGMAKAIRAHVGDSDHDKALFRIADTLTDVSRKHFYRCVVDISASGNSFFLSFDDASDPELPNDAFETICEALRDFARWIYKGLDTEWTYANADEQVDENIRANEYEFTEEGRRA